MENTQTKTDPMEIIAQLLKENNELRRQQLEGMVVIAKGKGRGGRSKSKPVVDTYTGKFYHTESAAGITVAKAEKLPGLMAKDGSINTFVFYSIPDREKRFIPYTGTPLTKDDDGKVVQTPKPPTKTTATPTSVVTTPATTVVQKPQGK